MKIAILGSGAVGQTLAAGFTAHGHSVTIGTRNPQQLADFSAANPKVQVKSVAEAASFGELAVLAVAGKAALAVLQAGGVERLAGKVVIDTTNPIADAPPVDGVLSYFTGPNESLMEQLQQEFASLRLVKAFNSVGAACMIDPQLAGGAPTMFIAGNDVDAKKQVAGLLADVGWRVADMGTARAARAIEPLAMLWCIPGFLRNDWVRAFKVLSPA